MSLYNNVAESLASSASTGNLIGSAISSIAGTAGSTITETLGGGKIATRIGQGVTGASTSLATQLVNKYIPVSYQKIINTGAGALSDLADGNWEDAALRVWDSGIISNYLPSSLGALSKQSAYWGRATPLFGGISPLEAKQIYDEVQAETCAKKNLWLLEITSSLSGGSLNMPDRFNLFATEISYSPYILAGDKIKLGGATMDTVQSNEPVEFQLTTYDDKEGNLKQWFASHHATACSLDGTVTEPGNYAIRIRVLHGFITDATGYEDIGLFRPDNLAISLSRREDNLEELQMTFSQLDTFMRV